MVGSWVRLVGFGGAGSGGARDRWMSGVSGGTASGRHLDAGYVAAVAAVCGVYFAAAKFGLSLASATQQVTAVWPPTGIALVALLLLGTRVWPGVLGGALLANATAHEAVSTALGIAVGNTLTAFAGALLLLRLVDFDIALERTRDVFGLVLVAIFTPLLSASNGVATLALHGVIPWSEAGSVWPIWWAGDAMGILLLAPVLLTWAARSRIQWRGWRLAECAAIFAALAAVSLVTLLADDRLSTSYHELKYTVFPVVIWAALRFGQRETASAVLCVAAFALWGAIHNERSFPAGSADQRLVLLELFMAVAALIGLVLSAVTAERAHAEKALRESEERRRRILSEMLAAEESERSRIATELHDDTVQVLTATLVSLDRARAGLRRDGSRTTLAVLDTARSTLALAVDRTRTLMFELRPQVLEARGIDAAVRDLALQAGKEAGFEVTIDAKLGRYLESVEILIYRTVLESVTNARKHSSAKHLRIRLAERDPATIMGEVEDDGRGFDVENVRARADSLHIGLGSLAERIRMAGGTCVITSSPGSGTLVGFTVPIRG
jgi:two-component system, NarL family, sensor histidine kinase FusK